MLWPNYARTRNAVWNVIQNGIDNSEDHIVPQKKNLYDKYIIFDRSIFANLSRTCLSPPTESRRSSTKCMVLFAAVPFVSGLVDASRFIVQPSADENVDREALSARSAGIAKSANGRRLTTSFSTT